MILVRFLNSGAWPNSLPNLYSERVSRLISEPGRSWARFPHSGAWPDSLSNLYSERVSRLISELGRSWARFPFLGLGQILYQISAQNVSPGSFPSLGARGIDSLFRGLALLQILTQAADPSI